MRILAAYLPSVVAPLAPPQLDAMVLGLHAFGPTLDLPTFEPSGDPSLHGVVVLLDVTGCAGLFGKPLERGEAVLAHKVREFFASLDLVAHVAIAEGPRLAGMFARLAHNPILVDREHTVQALAAVPLSVLPLTARELDYFLKLGFSTAGDLMALPSASLGARLSTSAERRKKLPRDTPGPSPSRTVSGPDDLLLLLRGDDRAPLRAHVRKEPPAAGADLAYPTASTEALSFVLKSLCDSAWCMMQGLSVRKVSVRLRIDRGERAREVGFCSTFTPALGNREDVLSALRVKLERTFQSEGRTDELDDREVQRVDLRFDETVPTVLANLSLYSSEARAARALPKLLAELREGLGAEQVGRLAVADSWTMTERSELVPYTEANARLVDGVALELLNVVEPTRCVTPESIDERTLEPLRLVLRLERDDWFGTGSARREIQMAWYRDNTICIERSGQRTQLLGYLD